MSVSSGPLAGQPGANPHCLHVLRSRDGGPVVVLRVLPGELGLSGTTRGALQLWDLRSGSCTNELRGHRGRITTLRVAANGRVAVTVDERRHLRVWDLGELRCRVHLDYSHHDDNVFARLAVAEDGAWALSTSNAGRGFIWDLERGRLRRQLELSLPAPPTRVELQSGQAHAETERGWFVLDLEGGPPTPAEPDPEVLHRDGHPIYRTYVMDEHVILRNVQSGEDLVVLDGHNQSILSAAISPDARIVLSGDDEGNIRVWELRWD